MQPREFQVGQELLLVNTRQPFYRFDFDYHFLLNYQISTKPLIENLAVKSDWNWLLPIDPHISLP